MGWSLTDHGSPDFLGVTPEGKVVAIEVKFGNDDLRPNQRAYRDVLARLGVEYRVERPLDPPERDGDRAHTMTIVTIPKHLRMRLERLKIVPREPVYRVIQRILDMHDEVRHTGGGGNDNEVEPHAESQGAVGS